MEPKMAMELILKNDNFMKENARVKTVICDEDAATINSLRREGSHQIEKWSDLNHSNKSMTTHLYELKMNKVVIDYFSKLFMLTIRQNKDDSTGVQSALLSVVPHAYGEHDNCGDWCKFDKDDPEYKHRHLPKGKDVQDKGERASIEQIFERYAQNAEKLAPCGSTQKNESFNHKLTRRHPKNKSLCGSHSFEINLLMTAAEQNEGSAYLLQLYTKMGYPHESYSAKFKERKDDVAEKRVIKCAQPEYKKNRNERKKQRRSKETNKERREGVSYKSNCGLYNVETLVSHCVKQGNCSHCY